MKQVGGKQLFTVLVVVGVLASLTVMATSYGSRPARIAQQKAVQQAAFKAAQVKRGEYLVTIGGCNDCHTPWIMGPKGPEPDKSRALSGHPRQFAIDKPARIESDRWGFAGAATNTAFSGPWGVSFAANLTPDRNTGTGIWTEEIFRNTIRNGRHWGVARPLLPPMPWFNYRHMSDEDLNAVFAYLRTVKPIDNQVPTPLPPAAPPAMAQGKVDSESVIR
jgi:mono/diheme cytochrome c family protein